jgi:metallo-beta-lactamase family protein
MELSFLGAAGEVTGSSFLLRTESVRVLIDCGLFEASRT